MSLPSRPQARNSLAAFALAALVILLPASVAAQSSRTETRNVAGFHNIALGVSADLELRQGTTEGLSITGNTDIVSQVETLVEGDTLKIRWVKGRSPVANFGKLVIVVDARSIQGLSLGGSGRMHANKLTTDKLRADIGGSGQLTIDALDATSVGISIGGSGGVFVAGRAEKLNASVAGSGELRAADLKTRAVHIAVQGSSTAVVRASDSLSASVAGSGVVKYHGSPKVSGAVAGSGRVMPAGEAS